MPYIFALLSLILLIPLILFLNIGISQKGKLLIMVSSLLIAVLGLLAQFSYPLWQTALILLLLTAVLTYLLNTRFEKVIFSNFEEIDIELENEEFSIIEDDEDDEEEMNEEMASSVLAEKMTHAPIQEKESVSSQAEIDMLLSQLMNQNDPVEIEDVSNEADEHSYEPSKDEELSSPLEALTQEQEEELLNLLNEKDQKAETVVNFDMDKKLEFTEDTILELEELSIIEESTLKSFVVEEEDKILLDFETDLEEISPIPLPEKVVTDSEKDELQVDFEEDEIIPIKEFAPILKEEDIPIKKELPVKKENYLSEIEKLLEEE